MMKTMFAVIAAAFLLSACDEPPPPAAAPPPVVAPPTFMVFFDWDRSNLSAQAMTTIQQAADAFKTKGGARVVATGHTDTSGPEAYNMALSLRRANTVKAALVKQGVPATAITTIGRGEAGLLVKTADGVREPQNRRVEIVVQVAMGSKDDMAYCAALSALYRKTSTRSPAQGPEPEAMAQCAAGNTAAGIPVLEKSLRDAKVELPKRMM